MNVLKTKDPFAVYIFTCFMSAFLFTFVFTVNLLYHVQIVKLDPLQLVLVGTVLELTVFLFEIPTGVVADLKSRKLSIVIGYFLIGVGFLIEGYFPYFGAVIFSQILWGTGYTFTSGAEQAWIADEIGEERASLAFVKGAKVGNLGKIIAIPLSILAGYSVVNLPIVIGGLCMVALSIILIFLMKEENFKIEDRVDKKYIWGHVKDNTGKIFYYSKTSFILRTLFLIALFSGFYSEGFDRLWMSHFIGVANLSTVSAGKLVLLMGGIQLIVVLLSFVTLHLVSISSIYQRQRQIYLALFCGSFLIIGSLLGFAFSTLTINLLIFYIIIQISRQAMNPLLDIWLNNLIIDSRTRATFFSVKGQIDSIGQISGGPVIGLIATKFMTRAAFISCAILLAPVLFLYYIILFKEREKGSK